MVQERLNKKEVSIEKSTYTFTYNTENVIQEIQITNDYPENNTIRNDNTNTLIFKRAGEGLKITWLWDGEYNAHYLIKEDAIYVFESDDENDLDLDNADRYPFTFEDGKLKYEEEENSTYVWEENQVSQYITESGKAKYITEYSYSDSPNPFYGMLNLGLIYIIDNNFIPYNYTLSPKMWITGETSKFVDNEKVEYDRDSIYSHTTDENGCVNQFIEYEKFDKIVYTFKY